MIIFNFVQNLPGELKLILFLRYVYVVVEKRLIRPVTRAAIKCIVHYVLEIACIHDCCGKKKKIMLAENHVSKAYLKHHSRKPPKTSY